MAHAAYFFGIVNKAHQYGPQNDPYKKPRGQKPPHSDDGQRPKHKRADQGVHARREFRMKWNFFAHNSAVMPYFFKSLT